MPFYTWWEAGRWTFITMGGHLSLSPLIRIVEGREKTGLNYFEDSLFFKSLYLGSSWEHDTAPLPSSSLTSFHVFFSHHFFKGFLRVFLSWAKKWILGHFLSKCFYYEHVSKLINCHTCINAMWQSCMPTRRQVWLCPNHAIKACVRSLINHSSSMLVFDIFL